MDLQTCTLVNGPFIIFTIVLNAFFIICLVCPHHGEKIKQPLKLLLGTLICCTITFLMSAVLQIFALFSHIHEYAMVTFMVFLFSLSKSMSSSAWLNFFYYTQIVPAQRADCIWIKKNIKPIIYCIWLAENIFGLFDAGVAFIAYSNAISYNSTMYDDMIDLQISPLTTYLYFITVCISKAYFIFYLCVMLISSSSTVVYLCRHMSRMAANGQPLSCPRFRRQVRVTVTGILQGVLFVFCSVWTVYHYSARQILYGPKSGYSLTDFTIINLYMVGTTFNLGAGQCVFRRRAADIWLRAVQWFKVPQVQQSEQAG